MNECIIFFWLIFNFHYIWANGKEKKGTCGGGSEKKSGMWKENARRANEETNNDRRKKTTLRQEKSERGKGWAELYVKKMITWPHRKRRKKMQPTTNQPP